jgi:hypothetical protein
LYCYGGFNFRCVFDNKKELLEVLSSFKKVTIYESFFVSGSENSVNALTMPKLHQVLRERDDEVCKALFRLIKNWNDDIFERFSESVSDPNIDPDTRQRHQKVLDNVKDHREFQMVLADFGLAAIFDRVEPCPIKNLRFEEYTKFDWCENKEEETRFYAYKGIPMAQIEKIIIEKLF